jgi:hypothetical protein
MRGKENTMPNARKAGKKKLGFWLTDEECEMLQFVADAKKVNKTDALRILLVDYSRRLIEDGATRETTKNAETK